MSAHVVVAERVLWLRLPRLHPLMMLPCALLGAVALPLMIALAVIAVAAGAVLGVAWPALNLLGKALLAALTYGTGVAS